MAVMHIDCEDCVARGPGCSDCVISLLLGPPDEALAFDSQEQEALGVLHEAGLVPPLRMDAGGEDEAPFVKKIRIV